MSGLVSNVIGYGFGRQSIGLTGEYQGQLTTISIDVTTSFVLTANVDITEHGIEKDSKNPIAVITDHVRPKLPTLSIEIIIADDLIESVTAKEKKQIISFWQRTGSIIQLEGYGTGSKVDNFIKKTLDEFRTEMKTISTELDSFSVGIDTDIIPSLVIGNITWKKTIDTGPHIGASMSLQRVYLATARVGLANSSKTTTNTGIKNAGKTDTKSATIQTPTNTSILDKLL